MRIQEPGALSHTNGSNVKRTYNYLLYPIKNVKSKFPYMDFCNQIYKGKELNKGFDD